MKNMGKRLLSLGLSMAVSATIFVSAGVSALAYTETTGTVSTDNVKVRESAGTTAAQVSSLKKGDTVEIIDEAADASGYTWFKIRVNKSEVGYVRSDLVTKKDGAPAQVATTTTTNVTESNAAPVSLAVTTATAVDPKSATITQESVNVRQGAGTGYDSVGKATKGETVTVIGEASGEDGKTWYQVTLSNGKEGYIRSDLLKVGEAAPAENTESAEGGEGQESQEAESQETAEDNSGSEEQSGSDTAVTSEAGDGTYSLVYSTDEGSEGIWYLYDNVGGYRVKVNELIEAAKSSDEVNKLVKTNNTYKTVLVILAIVIAALVVGLILLALKLRESYYEDDEEEEYDRYSKSARKRARDDDLFEEKNVNVRKPAEEQRQVRPTRDDSDRVQRSQRQVRRDDDGRDRAPRRDDERAVRRDSERTPRREDDRAPRRDDERAVRRDDERAPRRDDDRVSRRDDDRNSRRVDDRAARRSPDDRQSRNSRRDEGDDRASRRSSYRNSDERPDARDNSRRKARNFASLDEDEFEFEFLDLDDDK